MRKSSIIFDYFGFFSFISILSPSNRFKASTCNGDINGRELNLQGRRGLSLQSINGFN